MKNRVQIVILSIIISLCFVSPAFGTAPLPTFTDVSPQDWFAPYVTLCAETGLMTGTGENTFDPSRELTLTEALVLTARLHAKLSEDELPSYSLPEDPNDLVRICDQSGAQVGNFSDIQITRLDTRESMFLCFGDTLMERVGPQAQLTLTIDVRGLGYYSSFRNRFQEKAFVHQSLGYEEHLDKSGELERGYLFAQEEDDLWPLLMGLTHYLESNGDFYRSMVNNWWRDENLYLTELAAEGAITDPLSALESAWTADEYLLYLAHTEGRTWEELAQLDQEEFLSWPCYRGDLAAFIWAVTGPEHCPPLYDQTPPDTELEAAAALYQAGVLTGVDAAGSFYSLGHLTRAQAAAVLSRILDPTL